MRTRHVECGQQQVKHNNKRPTPHVYRIKSVETKRLIEADNRASFIEKGRHKRTITAPASAVHTPDTTKVNALRAPIAGESGRPHAITSPNQRQLAPASLAQFHRHMRAHCLPLAVSTICNRRAIQLGTVDGEQSLTATTTNCTLSFTRQCGQRSGDALTDPIPDTNC